MARILAVFLILAITAKVGLGKEISPLEEANQLLRYWKSLYPRLPTNLEDALARRSWSFSMLTRAQPSECFTEVGQSHLPPPCETGLPKISESYLWAMARTGDDLWLGTASNVLCGGADPEASEATSESSSRNMGGVCERDESVYPRPAGASGDWRPPRLYLVNTKTRERFDVTPPDPRLAMTTGIRALGTAKGYVVAAGSRFFEEGHGALHLFIYEASSRKYLGSCLWPGLVSIREWVEANGSLYAGVATEKGEGEVLRWQANPRDLCAYETVGRLPQDVGSLGAHEGRLYAGTWPRILSAAEIQGAGGITGIFESPPLGENGLDASAKDLWRPVWLASDYEPDPQIAKTYAMGPIISWKGCLVWGTMHLPFAGAGPLAMAYGSPSWDSWPALLLGSFRQASLFRKCGKDAPQTLYGASALPAFFPEGDFGHWQILPTGGGEPLFGPPGLGNFFNLYAWSMAVFSDKLFLGTLDASYNVRVALQSFLTQRLPESLGVLPLPWAWLRAPVLGPFAATSGYGADLFVFDDRDKPAKRLDSHGLGNRANMGIRTMLASEKALYLGTANPFSLLSDPDHPKAMGGWELWEVAPR